MTTADLCTLISELITYGAAQQLIAPEDERYTINRLLELFDLHDYAPAESASPAKNSPTESTPLSKNTPAENTLPAKDAPRPLHALLRDLTDAAVAQGLIEDTTAQRDLFDTRIMGLLTPPPSIVRRRFAEALARSPREATDVYYAFSRATNYIRTDRIARDEKWLTPTDYGDIEITINLSKPEKDPRDIARAGQAHSSGYPKCLLCAENEGYAGDLSHPARQNHRIIPLRLCGEPYYLQYSPYVYYNEHCIVFNERHIPMVIDRATFGKLFDFIRQFPHYTIGSNADLPIVGGSILSHDHFQGGRCTFPMARAACEEEFTLEGYPGVRAGIVRWAMSVIRLTGEDSETLTDAAEHILKKWRSYTDAAAEIYAETDGVPHNTITPIARRRGELYELDLVLRNNITTEECPMGLFHPHNEYHHIKKENIGLIEVQGLAILPARLKTELAVLKERILAHRSLREDETTAKHADWVERWLPRFTEAEAQTTDAAELSNRLDAIVQDEIGHYFVKILECAGVYKRTPEGRAAFRRFLACL